MTVYAWCQSTRTGHRFSVPLARLDRLLTIGAVVEIPGRRHTAPQRPKPRLPLGTPAVPMKRRRRT